jgi:hypothetical protein
MWMRRYVLGGAVAVLLTACGSNNATGVDTSPHALTGSWHGSSQGVAFDLDLTEKSGGQISGSGQLSGYAAGVLVQVQGVHPDPGFTITLSHTGYQSATYAGAEIGDSTLGGTINGSGFANFVITLYRQ